MNSPEIQNDHKPASAASKGNTKRLPVRSNNTKATPKRNRLPIPVRYQTQRSSKGSPTLYIMAIGACILLGGSYAMYLSTASQGTWYTAPASDGTFEPTSVPVTQPKASAVKPAPSTRISPSSSEVGRQSSRPIAVIDVPNVGLRNVPDIHMKASAASLKRGEHVEVIRKISGKGPAWVKIKTKSGKVGWVIASMVTPKKAG